MYDVQAIARGVEAANPGRGLFKFMGPVPLQTIAQAILSGQRMVDPQNAPGAVKIVHEIWKNGKKYQLEIIYREADKTILHVLYK